MSGKEEIARWLDQCNAERRRLVAKIERMEAGSARAVAQSEPASRTAWEQLSWAALASAIAGAVILPKIPAATSIALIALFSLLAVKSEPMVRRALLKVHARLGPAIAVCVLTAGVPAAGWFDWWRLHMPSSYRNAIGGSVSVETDKPYREGETVAGITWEKGFVETRLDLVNNAPVRLSNVELRLTLSGNAFKAIPLGNVEGARIDPVPRIPVQGVKVEYLNPDGTRQSAIAPAPDTERAALNETLTNTYTVRVPSWPSGEPVAFVFVGGKEREAIIGGFLKQAEARVDVIPERFSITGTYDVQHRDKTVTLRSEREISDSKQKAGAGFVPNEGGFYEFVPPKP